VQEARVAAMRIVKDVKRAGEIVSQIRQLFKKGTSQREFVDVNEIIREMTALLRGETTGYDILVGTDLAADLPHVTADRVQLQQVLMNLMMNSIDAMRVLMIFIRKRVERWRYGEGARELTTNSRGGKDEQFVVWVSDRGVGPPP